MLKHLPSTSWPITKSYWKHQIMKPLSADPLIGEIDINFDETFNIKNENRAWN